LPLPIGYNISKYGIFLERREGLFMDLLVDVAHQPPVSN